MNLPALSILASAFSSVGTESVDILAAQLREQAAEISQQHLMAMGMGEWETVKQQLKSNIIKHAGIQFFPELPLMLKETKRIRLDQLDIVAIRFQTRPGVFTTASLYIPDGGGPFPAIVLTHGHWPGGRNSDLFQEVAQNIAHHGYVCLTIDAWGAGERSSISGVAEYHGNNLGASLLNVGQTLLGMQVTENIRAVDLLSSLPMVNPSKLGATGASGGGNQAMWLSAIDERIKAVVPVVSVGTFQSYIMNSNCVCELLPSGLTFTEEAGVLGLIAPRALRMINAKQETNPAFTPQAMLHSHQYALPIFEQLGAANHIDYKLIDGGHGFDQAMQAAMIAWFDKHLMSQHRGPLPSFLPKIFEASTIATYEENNREKEVLSTARYCKVEGARHRDTLMHTPMDPEEKRRELGQLLGLPKYTIQQIVELPTQDGWEVVDIAMSPTDRLSAVFRHPTDSGKGYIILVHGQGYANLPNEFITDIRENGQGVVMIDLWGTGTRNSKEAGKIDGSLSTHHTLARSMLWFGQPMMGRWAGELLCITQWVRSFSPQTDVHFVGFREAGLATLYASSFEAALASTMVIDTPVSYLFDTREGVDYYNMSVHVPGILPWGDIGLLAALSQGSVTFRTPRTLAGNLLDTTTQAEHLIFFDAMRRAVNQDKVVRFE